MYLCGMKNTIKKGADPGIILELLLSNDVISLPEFDKKNLVKKKYSEYFGKTSKETIKANVREDIIVKNQKNRFLVKLPQDLKKLDIMAAHYDEKNDVIKITFSQQKGNNASFNSSSESKTLENIAKCINNNTYEEFFKLLPDNLNPIVNGKKYIIDVCIGMVNACGTNLKIQDNIEIKYLTGKDYLLYLGIELSTTQIAIQIENHNKIKTHTYDAVSECCNWDEIYDNCLTEINNDRI
jgi:hypothetical protein